MTTTPITYPHLAVVGRLEGDDEDSVEFYIGLTSAEAEAAFVADMRTERDIAPDSEHPLHEVYVNYVLTSDTPINIACSYTGFPTTDRED